MAHKIVAISTPSTAQPDSEIGSLLEHLSKVLQKADAPLRPELKSALTALLRSLPELKQTMTSADHSTLLYQTTAALALYDWVNPALGLQRDPSLKAPCLLAAIEAHATITGLMAHGVIDAAQINEIGLRIFRTPVDLTTIETLKQAYLDLRKTSVETRLETMFQNLVRSPIRLTDPDPLNPVPTAAEFTPKSSQLLALLSETMCPGLAKRSLPISDRWLALMATAKGIKISPRIFDSVRATGPIGTDLDTRLARLQNEAVKTAFRDIVSSIRTRQTGVHGIEKQRWETAEKRVGMAVEQLLGQTDISSDQEAACCALIDRWAGPIRDTCSVGVDLQLISFQKEQATLFGEVNQSNLNIKIASWVVARVSELLREKCALPFELSQDVHHVNLAIRLILVHMGGSSTDFSDPYEAGMRERITDQKAAIAKGFLEVSPLLDALHCSSGLSLEALVSGGVIATGETYVLDPMSWRRLAESCMEKLPFADFKSMGIDISERDGNLGCHRLSGGATRLGEELPRHPLTEFLIAAIRHEKLNADQRLELCDMANEKLTGEELAEVLSEAIGCGELTADQWRALCRMANEKLTGNELTYFLISASLYKTLNAEQWMGICHMAHEKLTGENLACVLNKAIACGTLNSDECMTLCRMATGNLTGDDLEEVLIDVVLHGQLNADQCMALCDMANGNLTGRGLADVLATAIRDRELNSGECMALCSMATGKLTGCDLADVLLEAIVHRNLIGEQCVALCNVANRNLTGNDLAQVLSTAIESEKLTGDNYISLCRMAISGNLTGRDLDYVFNTAILDEKLTDPQRRELEAMASTNHVVLE